jgi:hypothetical protein
VAVVEEKWKILLHILFKKKKVWAASLQLPAP